MSTTVSAVTRGRPQPLGATIDQSGVNFSIYSEYATSVELLLFHTSDALEADRIVTLDPETNHSFHFWHCHIADLHAGQTYAYRLHGPNDVAATGRRFDPEKVLLDPYARGNVNNLWDRGKAVNPGDNIATSMRSVVIDPTGYDWEGDEPLGTPLADTIIYETHVRGFTRSPTSTCRWPGTFKGLLDKLPHLQRLGITAVELLPIFDFDETQIWRTGPDGAELRNYWGYDPYGHFAPQTSYCIDPLAGNHQLEVRDMVKALHRAGIEVILDVVFNHTSEGNENGPMISLRGQGNEAYYHLVPSDKQFYMDYTGCGNTLNANHPIVTKYIIDALEAWVTDYHVDGFRFDLGSVLSRGPDGSPMSVPPVLWGIELSEVLSTVKVIAEAWDAGGLYQVSHFPGERWCVWNGLYRDTIRDFIRGVPGVTAQLATRIAGSEDFLGPENERPTNSINFITCHDGFTLNDLVTYNGKHNEANGESNRDGTDDNRSWNCGVEGPSDDRGVEELRQRQIKNAAAILLLSRGTPMILGGDEFRRTQAGNNNAYCQDGDLGWYDWTLADKNDDMVEFFARMVAFRKRYSALHRDAFFDGAVNERGVRDLTWHGCNLEEPNWDDPQSRVLACTLAGFNGEADLHVIMNMWDLGLDFALPDVSGRQWSRAVNTARHSPDDIVTPGVATTVEESTYPAWGHSVVVLVSTDKKRETMTKNEISFNFSDSIAGYVTGYDEDEDSFGLRTSDGREFTAHLTANTFAQTVRNIGDPYVDSTTQLRDMLVPERYLFAYGVFYDDGGVHRYDVKSVIFPTHQGREFVFEAPGWWAEQARHIADFYLRGQFPDGVYDWRNYRTKLSLSGTHTPDYVAPDFRQETDTISRLVYGLATAYLLTGEDRFLEAAESGTDYLREHMRGTDEDRGVVYWYHGMDVSGAKERKVLMSEFGDDFDAIPMYEQIYALAGPTQTYRVTGDPRILDDVDKTMLLFEKFYRDVDGGGYFSHLDPITFDPRSESLGHNRARKNWNSVGDHAPAYLINAVLSTGRKSLEDFLVRTADTIVEHFPDDVHSPFVQERFHEDWSADRHYAWQQDNAVVGHNLKIAWNLTRINHLRANDDYVKLANKIVGVMPAVGSDQQRGGWYDVVQRTRGEGELSRRFVWHDRKAWWQQEQAILAYYIMAGSFSEPEHLRLAREAASFYNAYFLDQDEGGVYFNVLADGIPFLTGNERLKGSHSMSGYHAIELCYLAAVYSNLLVNQECLELHFKPKASSFPDGVLRVSPDLLPAGRVKLRDVWVDDVPYGDFDPDALTVQLPPGKEVKVRVRIGPASERFESEFSFTGGVARIVLRGQLDSDQTNRLRRDLERVVSVPNDKLLIVMADLKSMSEEGINMLTYFHSKMDLGEEVYLVGASAPLARAITDSGGDFVLVDSEEAATS